jgi:hypothetical protein
MTVTLSYGFPVYARIKRRVPEEIRMPRRNFAAKLPVTVEAAIAGSSTTKYARGGAVATRQAMFWL